VAKSSLLFIAVTQTCRGPLGDDVGMPSSFMEVSFWYRNERFGCLRGGICWNLHEKSRL